MNSIGYWKYHLELCILSAGTSLTSLMLPGKQLELALLGNIAGGSQPLDGPETRLVRLSRHNAALVLHQVALLETTRRVGGTAVEHLLLGTNRGNAGTAHHVLTGHHVVPAHHVVLTRHHVVPAAVLARSVDVCLSLFRNRIHLVLPKQHIFFKEGRVSPHRKRTVLNGPTDPGLQSLYIRNWI